MNQWTKSLWCIFYSSQWWVHDDQWWVQDWSGLSPWSSLTSLWCIRDWSVMIMDWSGPYADIITDIITDQSLMHQGLVSDDPTPVSDESMKISDESRTGQGWVHDDQWRVQDWYWDESMVIETMTAKYLYGSQINPWSSWINPESSQTLPDLHQIILDLTLTGMS